MPKGKVSAPITDQEIQFAHLLLEGKLTDRRAAEAVGINPSTASYMKAKPRVKAYMDGHRASVRAGLVQHEIDALVESNIGREQLIKKLWDFACIDPEKTGYNTSSQIRAIHELREMLGFTGPEKGESEGKVDIYQPAWMRDDPDNVQ